MILHSLIKHSWLYAKRNLLWNQIIILNVLTKISLISILLFFTIIGLFLDKILVIYFPGSNPIEIVNSSLLSYFLIDLLIRIIFQKSLLFNFNHYLHLPIKRKEIVNYIFIR
jgi:hypothetical protein